MAGVIRLDTHVVVWLYVGDVERLSPQAIHALESHDLVVSPMVQLELSFLHEVGRLRVGGADIIGDLRARIGLQWSQVPMSALVSAATPLSWTRDPFDRLIVADATVAATALITKDETIRSNVSLARW